LAVPSDLNFQRGLRCHNHKASHDHNEAKTEVREQINGVLLYPEL
jgi:hypothetical protein